MESEEPMISAEMEDMRGLLYSTVSAFTKAIDERTPYNATHTKQVAGYTEGLLDFLQKTVTRQRASLACIYPIEQEDCQ